MTKTDLYSEVTNRIIADLESGITPWSQPWRGGAMTMPRNHSTGRTYSGINVLLLWNAQNKGAYDHNRWLTFKQCSDLGGHVRKGSKGTAIVFAKPIVTVAERERAKAEQRDARDQMMMRWTTVFNVAQCENLDLPEIVPATDPREGIKAADELFAATGIAILNGGSGAFYRPSSDVVHMPHRAAFPDLLDYYRTLAHELIHATGHKSRLDRNILNRFGSVDYAREELVAECGAAMLCAVLGIEYTTTHADYVGNWLAVLKEDNRAIFKAASMASKAAQWIEACAVEAVEPARELAFA